MVPLMIPKAHRPASGPVVWMQPCAASCQILAGVEGVEPANAGIKIRCLNQLGDTPTRDNCQLPCGAATVNPLTFHTTCTFQSAAGLTSLPMDESANCCIDEQSNRWVRCEAVDPCLAIWQILHCLSLSCARQVVGQQASPRTVKAARKAVGQQAASHFFRT